MYNTGNTQFLKYVCNPNREIDTKVELTFADTTVNLGTNDIVSYKLTYSSTGGKTFTPGSFVASLCELTLNRASSKVGGIDFKATPIVNFSIQASIKVHKTMVNIPMGVFYPETDGVSAGDDGFVVIKATDISSTLKTQFDSSILNLPCTIQSALDTISDNINTNIVMADFPNSEVVLTETFSLTTTYREALMYIAEAIGTYVQMNRSGEICFKRCFSGMVDIGCTLDDNYLFSVNKQENSVKPFQYIGIKSDKTDIGVTQEVTGVDTECRYDILNNPLTYGHPEDFLEGLVEPTTFTSFFPSKISFQGRPDLDTGDVIEYVYKGISYILPICSHVFEYNGGFKTTVESIGSDEKQVSSDDSGVKTQITAIKQNINSLLRDLSQTQSKLLSIEGDVSQVSTILQTVENLQTQVSKIEGDLETVSTLTQTSEQLRIAIQTLQSDLDKTNATVNDNQNNLLTYFDFKSDALTIGINNSNVKLKLSNNRIYFLKDDSEVAYFSEGKLYVMDAQFLRGLILGNFEFVPRNNGNLSLRRWG